MQGDNARTIDDQVVPDEEAKLLLAYYMEEQSARKSIRKNMGTLGETGNQIFFRIKRRGGQMPRQI